MRTFVADKLQVSGEGGAICVDHLQQIVQHAMGIGFVITEDFLLWELEAMLIIV